MYKAGEKEREKEEEMLLHKNRNNKMKHIQKHRLT